MARNGSLDTPPIPSVRFNKGLALQIAAPLLALAVMALAVVLWASEALPVGRDRVGRGGSAGSAGADRGRP